MYQTSETLAVLAAVFKGYSEKDKDAEIKKVLAHSTFLRILFFLNLFLSSFALPGINAQYKSIFEFKVKNAAGKETFWVIDLKKKGEVKKGDAGSNNLKADVTIILTDETFMDIAEGRTTPQKAFLTGGVKTKGNMLLGLKLDGILKVCQYCHFGHAHMTNCACYQEHEGKGEAVNCGAFVVSAAARHTYHRLIANLELIVCMVMCRERPGQW